MEAGAATKAGAGFLKILWIIGAVWLGLTFLVGIANGFVYWNKTGDWRPVVEASAGRIVSADTSIYASVLELQKEEISKEYADFLKMNILENIILLVLFIYLIYKFIYWLVTFGTSSGMESPYFKIVLVLAAVVIVGGIQFFYNLLVHGLIAIPYKGLFSTLFNPDAIFNTGSYSYLDFVRKNATATGQ